MKKSYYTDLAVQFKFGLLKKEIYRNIPKSTLYVWKNKDFSKMVGYDIVFTDEKLELMKAFLSNKRLHMPMFALTAHWITPSVSFTLLWIIFQG